MSELRIDHSVSRVCRNFFHGRVMWHSRDKTRKKSMAHRLIVAFVVLAIVLVGVRLALPYIVKDYVNNRLQQMESYTGSVEAVHLAIWRGAYTIDDILIEKRAATGNEPFFSADRLKLSLQWRALFNGALVGKANFEGAELNLIQSDDKQERQLGDENDWNDTLSDLFPFTFNEITVVDGVVRFRAPGISRKEALVLHSVDFSLRNLTNVFEADQRTFASFDLNGITLGEGTLQINGKLDPGAEEPIFEVAAELQKVALPELNPWLENYAGVNAKEGTFALFTEFVAENGAFNGYVKPIAKNIDVTTPEEDEDNILRKAWTGLVELAATIFKNQSEDQLATRVPISGSTDDPDADVLTTIVNILRNAFISAFSNSLENSIKLGDADKGNDKED